MVAAMQKRKMLCKTHRSNSVITVCRSLLIHLATFAARDQISRLVTMGYQSTEPVDETMSGDQFI